MNNKYTIKNFRVFDDKGATIDINPITILTGCNSSGKSSIVKSYILLNDYLANIKNDLENDRPLKLDKYKLDFTKKPNNLLGRFDKVVNHNCKDGIITFNYGNHSSLLSDDTTVELQFKTDNMDALNNGYLFNFSINNSKGETLYSSKKEKNSDLNTFNLIKKNFIRFISAQHLISIYHQYQMVELLGDDIYKPIDNPYKTIENINKDLIEPLKKIINEEGKNFHRDIIQWEGMNHEGSLLNKHTHNHPEILDKTKKYGILYYLPIFEWLENIKKKETKSFILEKIKGKRVNKVLRTCINKVLTDFEKSKFNTFIAYYAHYEELYLNQIVSNHNLENLDFNFKIQDKYIINNPFNTIYVLSDNNSFEAAVTSKEEIKDWEKTPISFQIIYTTLANLCDILTKESRKYFEIDYTAGMTFYHSIAILFGKYIRKIIEESLTPDFSGIISYVSSSRVSVQRLYSLEEKNDFSDILLRYFEARRNYDEEKQKVRNYIPNSFINKWIEKLGIGNSISFDTDNEGLGVMLRLHHTENNVSELLADKGYGITQLLSILLQIEVTILESKVEMRSDDCESIDNPNLFEKRNLYYIPATIAIEEPEIHLHPSFQSKLANIFLEAYQEFNIHFIIETHSEYLIRKLQTIVANKMISTDNVSLYYVYDKDSSYGESPVKKIKINEDGRLNEPFGTGFYDEADNLSMDLLMIKTKHHE